MNSERITWAEIMTQRQEDAHRREEEDRAWLARVTEQLANEQSKFLKDFDENERRIFGIDK